MDLGVVVTVNSDDPAYFGGYVADNFLALSREAGLTLRAAERLARNSIAASFVTPGRAASLIAEVDRWAHAVRDRPPGRPAAGPPY